MMFKRGTLFGSLLAMSLTSASQCQTVLYLFNGDDAGDHFGYSVSCAGDVNADGVADVIIGAPFDDNIGQWSGSARVVSGWDGSNIYTFNGDTTRDRFGWDVDGAGDVNGDGFADVIVGAMWADKDGFDGVGMARVFSGKDGSAIHTFAGTVASQGMGWSVGGAGDVNGDGFADLIVGTHGDDTNGLDAGLVHVYSGQSGERLFEIKGNAGDQLGFDVSGAGDVNGDGYDDFMVASLFVLHGPERGAVTVYSGLDGNPIYTLDGGSTGHLFGTSLSSAGDVNGDGVPDIIIGVRQDSDTGAAVSGSARVFSGDGSPLYTLFSGGSADNFGSVVSGAGDLNGDGFADVVVGAPRDDTNGYNSGSVWAFSGEDGSVLLKIDGSTTDAWFGYAVSGAGDVDGDGYDEIVVGAALSDNNSDDSGAAFVIGLDGPIVECDPLTAISQIIGMVVDLNLQNGIENSLDAKLDAAFNALSDVITQNDVAAINAMEAFINAVLAQAGNKIPLETAPVLIAAAEDAIAQVDCASQP